MQDCPPPLIDSTTGHYNSTCTHRTSLWSAFLASVQQGRALECAFVALNITVTYCHTSWKYTRSFRNTDASIIRTSSGGPMLSAIEGFHCKAMLHPGPPREQGSRGKAFMRKYAEMFNWLIIDEHGQLQRSWFDVFTRIKDFVYTNRESITDYSTQAFTHWVQTMPGKWKIKKHREDAVHKSRK